VPFRSLVDPNIAGLTDLPQIVEIVRDASRRLPLLARPDLTYLFWESTLRCNLKCSHCGSRCEPGRVDPELTRDEVLGILDTIAQDFDATRIFVSITGGEPLLRPDLVEVVAHMTSLGMRSCIVTNGTLLDAERASQLFDAGMRTISVSIDGMQAEHEIMRGKGSWARALSAITLARKAGFPVVEAITCVRPSNLTSLPAVERAVRDAGAVLWRLITLDRMGRLEGDADPAMWLDPWQIRTLLDFIERRRRELAAAGDPFGVQFSCGGFLGPRRELKVRSNDGQCFAGLCVASILSDGSVSACPSLPRSWAQGSARRERFSSIWHNKFGAFRDVSWRRSGICADCSWFKLCLGGGLHERLAQPDSFCWLDRQRDPA
jgi:radical SAM protein with 4Fe4S-binding SPASM domain